MRDRLRIYNTQNEARIFFNFFIKWYRSDAAWLLSSSADGLAPPEPAQAPRFIPALRQLRPDGGELAAELNR